MSETVEISREDLLVREQALQLLNKLNGNKETRRDFQRAVKKVVPDFVSEDDVADEHKAELSKDFEEKLKPLVEFKENLEKNQKAWEETESFSRLKKSGWTEDGITQVKKVMEEKKISDPEIAAAWYEKKNPPKQAEPAGYSGQGFQHFENETEDSFKKLADNPQKWADEETHKILREMRGQL